MYDTADGDNLVSIRMEAEEAAISTIEATSDCSSFYAGGKFKLTKHAAQSEKDNYIITGIYHRAFDNSYFSGSEGQSEYGNNFVCIPADVHFRPLRTQNKPVMKGPQSAVVTGPSGEEIYIDKFGRIKVQFMWDREGKKDESSSCYLRVVQSWSGGQWGSSFIPRIGQEVIINFLDGDPDRPLVTGTVYNGENKPPYTSKTQSGIKTQSTKGAGKQNYNELRFEDLKGSEEIFVQAEKDFNVLVKNDHSRTLNKGNEIITVSKGNRTLSVKNKISTDASDIIVKAKKSIEFKVGGSSIKMTPSGIVIKATKIDVKGSAMVVLKGGITKIN
jgi:type VI secretion system secreted protein VgrG